MRHLPITQHAAAYPIIDKIFNQVYEESRMLTLRNTYLSKLEITQCSYEQILRISRVISLFEYFQRNDKMEMFHSMVQSIIRKNYLWTIYYFKKLSQFDLLGFKQFLAPRLKEEALDEISWKCYCFSGLILAYILHIPSHRTTKDLEEICTFYKRPTYILSNMDRKRINKLKKSNPDEWESLALPIRNNSMAKIISSWENISIASLLDDINLKQKDMESWLTIVMQEKNIIINEDIDVSI